jgi:hypothetical protein
MIKNIRVRKVFSFAVNGIRVTSTLFLMFVTTRLFTQPEITIPNLEPESIQQLHKFSKDNPGAFTIHLVPKKKWLACMTDFVSGPFAAFRNACTLKNISLTLVSAGLSLGWISYLLCAYLIYKTYLVIKNVNSWANWCSNDDLLSDYDALYKKFNNYKRMRASTKKSSTVLMTLHQEKELLGAYLRLDAFLNAHKIRHYFPYARGTHIQIISAYKKLQKIETLLAVRKKRMHFARKL